MFTEEDISRWLDTVYDPEIPVLTIKEMGILRGFNLRDEEVEICYTPTYSGCPAMDAIRMQIRMTLMEQGVTHIKLTEVLTPSWTSDWMTETGKKKLKAYGIAPPDRQHTHEGSVPCPRCGSVDTGEVSAFGSTSCKALYRCHVCLEPFDYFKCH